MKVHRGGEEEQGGSQFCTHTLSLSPLPRGNARLRSTERAHVPLVSGDRSGLDPLQSLFDKKRTEEEFQFRDKGSPRSAELTNKKNYNGCPTASLAIKRRNQNKFLIRNRDAKRWTGIRMYGCMRLLSFAYVFASRPTRFGTRATIARERGDFLFFLQCKAVLIFGDQLLAKPRPD